MHFALSVGGITDDDWYLELEDDSPPNIPNWADFVTNWMNEHFPRDTKSHEWTMIRFFADRQAVETKTITPVRERTTRNCFISSVILMLLLLAK
jgi:hypothetical protein